jgi:hypothetical protein
MKKLNKNFQEQRKSVEAMMSVCANNTCVCDYPDTCNCNSTKVDNSSMTYMYNSLKSHVDTHLKKI